MKKILVIEDMDSLRDDIIQILECLDFQAIGASDGLEGVARAKTDLPDLIICDIMMPELDGYGVFKSLSEDLTTATIPFIFLSAKADKSDIRHGMNLGADDYLTKPFKIEELHDAITARLERKAKITQSYINKIAQVEQNLTQLADYDSLTNLPNRISLHRELENLLLKAKEHKKLVAILCLNINRFQAINVTFGNLTGDLLLQSLSKRLNQSVRQTDIIFRLSGDEFIIVLFDVDGKENVTNFAERLLRKLSETYTINGNQIRIQLRIGITIYPEDNSNVNKLLNNADLAMRCAKNKNGSNFQFYNPQMESLVIEQQLLESHLSYALDRSEFQVYYQPQVNLATGKIIGAEALLRWQHPELGMISPVKFIPLAEKTGLIIPIGEWILRTACIQVKNWQLSHISPVKISVNISTIQLKEQNFIATIMQILEETGIDPHYLQLELTETNIMQNVNDNIKILEEIKALGINISVDDFGTGYSSLNYLKYFPIDTLKIDKSFVTDSADNDSDAAITIAIITMAHNLKFYVIAEGVETSEQFNFLRENGCDAMQGYLFSPAVPASKFEQLLLENRGINHINTI